MTTEEIIAGNRLLAEFMGMEYRKLELSGLEQCRKKNNPWKTLNDPYNLTGKGIIYRSSWDWLMPVVEKIESMEICDGVEIVGTYVAVNGGRAMICEANGKTKIESVWSACVEFAKWYKERLK